MPVKHASKEVNEIHAEVEPQTNFSTLRFDKVQLQLAFILSKSNKV